MWPIKNGSVNWFECYHFRLGFTLSFGRNVIGGGGHSMNLSITWAVKTWMAQIIQVICGMYVPCLFVCLYFNKFMFKIHSTHVFNGKIWLCSLLLWLDPVLMRRTLTPWPQSFLINFCQIGYASSRILYLWSMILSTSSWFSLSTVTRTPKMSYERR